MVMKDPKKASGNKTAIESSVVVRQIATCSHSWRTRLAWE